MNNVANVSLITKTLALQQTTVNFSSQSTLILFVKRKTKTLLLAHTVLNMRSFFFVS